MTNTLILQHSNNFSNNYSESYDDEFDEKNGKKIRSLTEISYDSISINLFAIDGKFFSILTNCSTTLAKVSRMFFLVLKA